MHSSKILRFLNTQGMDTEIALHLNIRPLAKLDSLALTFKGISSDDPFICSSLFPYHFPTSLMLFIPDGKKFYCNWVKSMLF